MRLGWACASHYLRIFELGAGCHGGDCTAVCTRCDVCGAFQLGIRDLKFNLTVDHSRVSCVVVDAGRRVPAPRPRAATMGAGRFLPTASSAGGPRLPGPPPPRQPNTNVEPNRRSVSYIAKSNREKMYLCLIRGGGPEARERLASCALQRLSPSSHVRNRPSGGVSQ